MPNKYHKKELDQLENMTIQMKKHGAGQQDGDRDDAFYEWAKLLSEVRWSWGLSEQAMVPYVDVVIDYLQKHKALSIGRDFSYERVGEVDLLMLILRHYHRSGQDARLFNAIIDSNQHRFYREMTLATTVRQAITFCVPDALGKILGKMQRQGFSSSLNSRIAHGGVMPLELALSGHAAHWPYVKDKDVSGWQLQLVKVLLESGADPSLCDRNSTDSRDCPSLSPIHKMASGSVRECVLDSKGSSVYVDILKLALTFKSCREALSLQNNEKKMTPLLCMVERFVSDLGEYYKGPSRQDMEVMFHLLVANGAQDLPDVDGRTAKSLLIGYKGSPSSMLAALEEPRAVRDTQDLADHGPINACSPVSKSSMFSGGPVVVCSQGGRVSLNGRSVEAGSQVTVTTVAGVGWVEVSVVGDSGANVSRMTPILPS
jgi:hypothetical protein